MALPQSVPTSPKAKDPASSPSPSSSPPPVSVHYCTFFSHSAYFFCHSRNPIRKRSPRNVREAVHRLHQRRRAVQTAARGLAYSIDLGRRPWPRLAPPRWPPYSPSRHRPWQKTLAETSSTTKDAQSKQLRVPSHTLVSDASAPLASPTRHHGIDLGRRLWQRLAPPRCSDGAARATS